MKSLVPALSPEQRLRALWALFQSANELKAAAIRQANPQWSQAEVHAEVRRQFLFTRDTR